MKNTAPFTPTMCDHCGQTTDYLIKLAKGDAMIVLAVYHAAQRLGKNQVHLRDDMECSSGEFASYQEMAAAGRMTSKMIDNVLRAKYCGLLAQAETAGTYLITPRGADFLFRNRSVERLAIIEKRTHTKLRYLETGDPAVDRATFGQLMNGEAPWWDFNEATLAKVAGLSMRPEATEAML